ncbi:lipase (class 3) domain-containing protein [Ditylenchus destructor]|nr:lipase (class 3) domain-containing protein [Ditylenchus destructor]
MHSFRLQYCLFLAISSIFICISLPLSNANPIPKQTDYDEEYARKMLNLAAGAYSLTPDACIQRTFTSAHKYTLVNSNTESCDGFSNLCSFYVSVSELRREIIVVFRGTKSKEQLFLEGWQSLQPGVDFYGIGKVNKYFFRALNTLWDNLEPALIDQKYKDYNVTFTGHSLGGALASLASIRTVLDNRRRSDQIKLYTFGQPRVGCSKFAFKHDELVPHSFRVINRLDIVPHLPPCAKNKMDPRVEDKDDSKPCDPNAAGIAYHHGTEIWYPNGMGPSNRYYECLGEPKNEDFHCSDSVSYELSKYATYIFDHRHYFEHKVPSYGKLGCVPNSTREESIPNDAVVVTANTGLSSAPTEGRFSKIAQAVGRLLGRHS